MKKTESVAVLGLTGVSGFFIMMICLSVADADELQAPLPGEDSVNSAFSQAYNAMKYDCGNGDLRTNFDEIISPKFRRNLEGIQSAAQAGEDPHQLAGGHVRMAPAGSQGFAEEGLDGSNIPRELNYRTRKVTQKQ
jgi:hypothetical protein